MVPFALYIVVLFVCFSKYYKKVQIDGEIIHEWYTRFLNQFSNVNLIKRSIFYQYPPLFTIYSYILGLLEMRFCVCIFCDSQLNDIGLLTLALPRIVSNGNFLIVCVQTNVRLITCLTILLKIALA